MAMVANKTYPCNRFRAAVAVPVDLSHTLEHDVDQANGNDLQHLRTGVMEVGAALEALAAHSSRQVVFKSFR